MLDQGKLLNEFCLSTRLEHKKEDAWCLVLKKKTSHKETASGLGKGIPTPFSTEENQL